MFEPLWVISADARAQWSDTFAPGLGLRAAYGARLGGFVELNAAWPRSVALGEGTVTWNRFALALGAHYRSRWERFVLEPGLSLELGALWARAAGFVQNDSRVVPDLGMCAHLRAGVRLGDALLFTGARACGWPLPTRTSIEGVTGSVLIPAFELSAVFGASWEWVTGSSPSRLSPP